MYTSVMSEITSLQNPRIKYIVKLRDNKRQRRLDGLTIVEGRYELETALSSRIQPVEVFRCLELTGGSQIPDLGLQPLEVSRHVFQKMSQRENPDGWLATFPIPHRSLADLSLSSNPLLVLIEAVEKPGNLGAILRTSDAAGVDGVLLCDHRVELFNPNVVRASRGTLFTVNAVEADNLEALTWLRHKGILVVAASPDTEILYTEVDFCGPVCLVLGTEDEGLTDFWLKNADRTVKIPMVGKVNSLNVSASTAILLFEAVRQRTIS